MTPTRIQRSRAKGARQPEGTRYCGRGTIYGNPFEIGFYELGGHTTFWDRHDVVSLYNQELSVIVAKLGMTEEEFLEPLMQYKYLSCFCATDEECHVDVLIDRLQRMTTYWQMPLELETV